MAKVGRPGSGPDATGSSPVVRRELILLFLKGVAMGAAEVVPGVSGGTIAFITGVYERLLAAINSIDFGLIGVMREGGVAAVWRRVDANFLLALFAGMGLSILTLARLISLLLAEYPILIWSFFLGLILASIVLVSTRVRRWQAGELTSLLFGAVFGVLIVQLVPIEVIPTPATLALGGALAVCAWILPGLSGSFILLILGLYSIVLEAVAGLDFLRLGSVALGCVIGLMVFARILGWLFSKYHDQTLGMLCGFMAGSLVKIWPWKNTLSYQMSPDGHQVPLVQEAVSPATYAELTGLDPQLWIAILLVLFGMFMVLGLHWISRSDSTDYRA